MIWYNFDWAREFSRCLALFPVISSLLSRWSSFASIPQMLICKFDFCLWGKCDMSAFGPSFCISWNKNMSCFLNTIYSKDLIYNQIQRHTFSNEYIPAVFLRYIISYKDCIGSVYCRPLHAIRKLFITLIHVLANSREFLKKQIYFSLVPCNVIPNYL